LVLVPSPLRITTSIFFQLNTCFHIRYATSSLMRGWVYRLQLLLELSGQTPAGLVTTFCCLILETSQPRGPGPRI
jgi:hypothetical protein